RGNAILLYRDPVLGWKSSIIHDADTGFRSVRMHSSSYSDGTLETTKRGAELHLAQMGWQPDDGESIPEILSNCSDIAEFRSWAQFRTRFHAARLQGMNPQDASDYAGRNPARRELWEPAELQTA